MPNAHIAAKDRKECIKWQRRYSPQLPKGRRGSNNKLFSTQLLPATECYNIIENISKMNIEQQISGIIQLHDAYSADRYNEHRPVELINQFNEWHSKSATLFSSYIDAEDEDLTKFKNIEKGNSYVLAGVFSDIEAYFHVLVDKLRSSVAYQLESLISEGEQIVQGIREQHIPDNVICTYTPYQLANEASYQTWKNKAYRLLTLHFNEDGMDKRFDTAIENLAKHHNNPKYVRDMIGVLQACKDIPAPPKAKIQITETPKSPLTINVHQSQTQNQSQVINIFLESISDEITGKQLKELKAIANEEKEPEKAKSKILEKVKSFGSDVLSNIVANIITNPSVWTGLM